MKRLKYKICGFLTSNRKISLLAVEIGKTEYEVGMERLRDHYDICHPRLHEEIQESLDCEMKGK